MNMNKYLEEKIGQSIYVTLLNGELASGKLKETGTDFLIIDLDDDSYDDDDINIIPISSIWRILI